MTDVATAPASPASPPVEPVELAFFPEEVRDFSQHREINERRGRVENPELLRRLRSL